MPYVYSLGRQYDPQAGKYTCEHFDRLTRVWLSLPGLSEVAEWAGRLPPGPHSLKSGVCLAVDSTGQSGGDDIKHWHILTVDELLAKTLTTKDTRSDIRGIQANCAKQAGFCGPIKGGEARAISRFLRAIGKEDHVRRLWVWQTKEWVKWPGTGWERRGTTKTLRGPIYAFKPFLDGHTFEDFMRVFRMMRPGFKDARKAIREAMASPTIKEDLEMLSVFDTMSSMGGSK